MSLGAHVYVYMVCLYLHVLFMVAVFPVSRMA